jgi:hypothetical protein
LEWGTTSGELSNLWLLPVVLRKCGYTMRRLVMWLRPAVLRKRWPTSGELANLWLLPAVLRKC